jgi:hypothetical protein
MNKYLQAALETIGGLVGLAALMAFVILMFSFSPANGSV